MRLLPIVFLTLLAGCGRSDRVAVTGQLRLNGEPYALGENEQMAIQFYAQDKEKAKEPFIAQIEPNGSYKVAGGDNAGIPIGKYRVGITSVPRPSISSPKVKMEDKFKGAFSATTSPHVVDVASGSHAFDLELNPAKVK